MEEEKERIKIKEWYNRFDDKLKSLKETNLKLNLIKSDIIDNQRLLEEYKMDRQNIEKKAIKKRKIILDKNIETRLIRRVNINNYDDLDSDNIFLKKILEKIKQRKEMIKKGKNLPFKRYRTNNDYGNVNLIYQNNNIKKITLNKIKNNNNNILKLTNILDNKNDMNRKMTNNIIKKEKPLILKQKKNLILNLDCESNKDEKEYSIKDIINLNYKKNMTENNVNFFETLSHEDKMKDYNSKKDNKIKNMIRMVKIVKEGLHNCELSGNLLNKNIEKTKSIMKLKKSMPKNKSKLIIKINYSKIKDLRDVEKQIFTFPEQNLKNNKSVSGLKSSKKKDVNKDKNKLYKKFVVLPICTTNSRSRSRSYLKKNDNILI